MDRNREFMHCNIYDVEYIEKTEEIIKEFKETDICKNYGMEILLHYDYYVSVSIYIPHNTINHEMLDEIEEFFESRTSEKGMVSIDINFISTHDSFIFEVKKYKKWLKRKEFLDYDEVEQLASSIIPGHTTIYWDLAEKDVIIEKFTVEYRGIPLREQDGSLKDPRLFIREIIFFIRLENGSTRYYPITNMHTSNMFKDICSKLKRTIHTVDPKGLKIDDSYFQGTVKLD